jgi:hypothetical protein
VAVLGGHDLPRGLLHYLPSIATAHGRHDLGEVPYRLAHGRGVRDLHVLSLRFVSQRPHSADRLRSAESQVDPAATAAASTLPAKPRAAAGVATLHQRDEVPALDCAALDPQPRERLGGREPPAGGLGGLALGREVVIAALRLDGL